jgi:hypothetical protein
MKLKLQLLAFIALAFTGLNLDANLADLNRDKRISRENSETVQQSDAKKNWQGTFLKTRMETGSAF